MSQPRFSVPTRFAFGTFTPSKKVSQKGDLPEIRRIGLVETPGQVMSNSRKEMPRCLGAAKSVRTRQKIMSALSA
jgi:hypothetical protein